MIGGRGCGCLAACCPSASGSLSQADGALTARLSLSHPAAGHRWVDCDEHHRESPCQPPGCPALRNRRAEWEAPPGPINADHPGDVRPHPRQGFGVRGFGVVRGSGSGTVARGTGAASRWGGGCSPAEPLVPTRSCRCPVLPCRQSSHHRGWRCEQRAGRAGQDPGGGLPGAAVHGPHLLGATGGGQSQAGAGGPIEVSGATWGLKLRLMWYQFRRGSYRSVFTLHAERI